VTSEARSHRDKAERLRRECGSISPAQAPDAVISLSYYAVYHACVAALLAANATAPRKHGKVHDAIGKLADSREASPIAREIKQAVEQAYEMRIRADYDPGARPDETRADAERIPALRDTVVAFCDRVIDAS
jgi:uncharacterized protein (UPF0332 family)